MNTKIIKGVDSILLLIQWADSVPLYCTLYSTLKGRFNSVTEPEEFNFVIHQEGGFCISQGLDSNPQAITGMDSIQLFINEVDSILLSIQGAYSFML